MRSNKTLWWMSLGCLSLVVSGLLFSTTSSVSAATLGGVSVSAGPAIAESLKGSRMKYILSEGGEIRDSVEITNGKSETVTVFLFSSGYTIENNAIKRLEPTTLTAGDPGYWTEFDKQEVVVRPSSSVRVGFTVKVPANADVGEHGGAILVGEKKPASQTKGGSGLQVVTRVGLRLLVIVPGDVDRTLVVKNIRHTISANSKRVLTFMFDLTNDGNILLGPTLDTRIRGFFGPVGEAKGAGTDLIGRGQTVTTVKDWIRRAPYFGRFVADFTFHLGEYEQINKDLTKTMLPDQTVTARYVFWIIPWMELIYFVVFILILYLLRSLWLYLLIMRRLKVKTKIHSITKNDTLMKIATKYGVDPTVLAKFNLLRWPYDLHVGDDLLIPTGQWSQTEWKTEYAGLLDRRELFGGVLKHWFSRRNVHHMARQLGRQIAPLGKPAITNTEVVVVDRGDTIKDVAAFAGTTVATVARLNHLKAPYRLRAGQELLIPKNKPTKKRRS